MSRSADEILGEAEVVASTCVGAGCRQVARRSFYLCVVDEASQVNVTCNSRPLNLLHNRPNMLCGVILLIVLFCCCPMDMPPSLPQSVCLLVCLSAYCLSGTPLLPCLSVCL